jgi:hypothetical protein
MTAKSSHPHSFRASAISPTDCCLRPVREERKATGAHGPLETGNAEEASGRLHDAGPSGASDRGLTARSGGKRGRGVEVQPGCFREGTYPSVSMRAAV